MLRLFIHGLTWTYVTCHVHAATVQDTFAFITDHTAGHCAARQLKQLGQQYPDMERSVDVASGQLPSYDKVKSANTPPMLELESAAYPPMAGGNVEWDPGALTPFIIGETLTGDMTRVMTGDMTRDMAGNMTGDMMEAMAGRPLVLVKMMVIMARTRHQRVQNRRRSAMAVKLVAENGRHPEDNGEEGSGLGWARKSETW